MPNNVVVLDLGYGLWKGKTAGREYDVRHALMPLPESDYESVMKASRNTPPEGYIRVNGQAYAFGTIAEKRGAKKRSGAGRYEAGYAGVAAAIMLSLLYPNTNAGGDVTAFVSYPPGDSNFENDLIDAILGRYHLQVGERENAFRIVEANSFAEPVGGLMNVMLRENGQGAQHDLFGGDTLVIDIGEHTTDFISVDGSGVIDSVVYRSERIGIRSVVDNFERSLYGAYPDQLKDTAELPAHKIREAIRTGIFRAAGSEYLCGDLAREAAGQLLRQIENTYQNHAGGAAKWDSIVLTGGGSAMLFERLRSEVLKHNRVFIADNDFEAAHRANVRGGLKLWRFYEAQGVV